MTRVLTWKQRSALCLLVVLCILAVAGPAAAQPARPLAEDYVRTDFNVEDGLPDDVVNAVLQSRNGLLWVGTESGLASFDGQKFTPIKLGVPGTAAHGAVQSLVEGTDGDLWVATHAGIVRIPRADLDHFDPAQAVRYHLAEGRADEVGPLLVDHNGVLWAGSNRGLYKFAAGKFVEVIPAFSIIRITEALNGHLLIITGNRLIEWDGSRVIQHPEIAARLHVHPDEIFHAYQDHSGTMWYSTGKGIVREGSRGSPPLRPLNVAKEIAYRTYEDPDGNVWIASTKGLQLAIGDTLEAPTTAIEARCIYADQDGDVWVGTNGNGLVRLKHRIVQMFTSKNGLPNDVTMTVIAAHDGRVWVGNNCAGLSVFDGKSFKTYSEKDGLTNSCVWALAEENRHGLHDLWIGTFGGGLFRFRNGSFSQYSTGQGLVSSTVLQIVVARDGSLWIATPDGVSHMVDRRFRNYTTADGLSSDRVSGIYEDQDGTVWAATQGGLDRLAGSRFERFPTTGQDTAPFSLRFSTDLAGNLYTANSPRGISLIANDELRNVNDNLKVLDLLETADHDIWFSGGDGIGRVAHADLDRTALDRAAPLDYAVFDRADGLSSMQCSVGIPNLALTPDRKLWVATVKGLAMLDLAKLPRGHRRPKILIGAITIGRDKQLAGSELTLAPGTHHVEVELQAVDLASPEKMHIQYRLDGVDAAWLDADPSLTAIYTDVPLGTHALQVRAKSSDGVWDRTGITYNITQLPYFYQTGWFRLLIALSVLLLLSALYLGRVRFIIRQTNNRLQAQLLERERIARELHDTLLQSVQGLVMRFHTATRQIPPTEPARRMLEQALDQSDEVIAEGRARVLDLRQGSAEDNDLVAALNIVAEELSQDSTTEFAVASSGVVRALHPVVRDEVYRIGREAITNAFRHAGAQNIEIEIDYGRVGLELRVRDDGRGLEPRVSEQGYKSGHWGLHGMRERAQAIGGKLDVWSRPGAGTEIELRIPANIAFKNEWKKNRWSGLSRILTRGR